jgi:glucan biosynthesis protein C
MKGLEVETPVDFVPVPKILAFYAVFSALGWFLHRQPDLVQELGKRLWIPALGALVLLPLLGATVERMVKGEDPGSRLPALLLSGAFTGCTVTLFLGLFVRYAERERAWVSWLSDASYWSYLLHLPVTVALQVWVADKPWHGLVKYVLVLVPTAAACLLSYRLLVRHTWLGEALNGRRIPRSA